MDTVFFDLYSTLIHEFKEDFYVSVFSELGEYEVLFPFYKNKANASMLGQIDTMAERVFLSCVDAKVNVYLEEVELIVNEHIDKYYASLKLYDDTHSILKFLKNAGFKLGLISNASSYSEEVLDRFRIRKYFDCIIMSYQYGVLKPHKDIYQIALDKIKSSGENSYYVGDGGDDELEGAKSLGMTTILVDNCQRDLNANYKVHSLSELVRISTNDVRLKGAYL